MQEWLWFIIAVLVTYVFQIAVILLQEHRRQANMAAWIFVVMICPYLGFAAYWLLGRRRKIRGSSSDTRLSNSDRKRGNQASITNVPSQNPNPNPNRLGSLIAGHLPYPSTINNRATVLTDGNDTFQSILEAIGHAQHHIHMDYYTIRNDGIGSKFLDKLVERASAGVEVRVLYDGIGSLHLDKMFLEELRRSGAQSACFSAPGESLLKRRLNFRNHRKIVVVDGRIGYMGGINIGDEYLGMDQRLGYWRDSHLKLEGDSVHHLQSIFMDNWQRATNVRLKSLTDGDSPYFPAHHCEGEDRIVLIPGKPGVHDGIISETLFVAMSGAERSIFATTPYFIPDPSIAASLRIAARSGIDVKLIIPGISDSKLVLFATLSYVQDMLDAGVQVYRYGKGFIHAKVMIIDGKLASIGSANLDMRSLYSNYELLALIEGEEPVGKLTGDFLADLKNSKRIDQHQFAHRPAKQKAAEALLHLLSPLL